MAYAIEGATHRTVSSNGVGLSVYEAGEGPAVVFSHGFPELAYSWRSQLAALAGAGYRAIAPDQRGYGGTEGPAEIEAYDIFHLTGDLVGLLDALEIDKAVFVGHDWGGFIVWQMPLLHPDRVAGVIGVNTPYSPRFPMPPTELFRMVGGDDHYILHFQEPGVADAALAKDVRLVFTKLMRSGVAPEDLAAAAEANSGANFVDALDRLALFGEPIMSDGDLDVYVDTFTRTGFTGGLNWYRNFDRNWEQTPELDGAHITVPSLMVTAEWDPVLTPSMAQIMPPFVDDLEIVMIEQCGHWTQQDKAEELNAILIDWLDRRYR